MGQPGTAACRRHEPGQLPRSPSSCQTAPTTSRTARCASRSGDPADCAHRHHRRHIRRRVAAGDRGHRCSVSGGAGGTPILGVLAGRCRVTLPSRLEAAGRRAPAGAVNDCAASPAGRPWPSGARSRGGRRPAACRRSGNPGSVARRWASGNRATQGPAAPSAWRPSSAREVRSLVRCLQCSCTNLAARAARGACQRPSLVNAGARPDSRPAPPRQG